MELGGDVDLDALRGYVLFEPLPPERLAEIGGKIRRLTLAAGEHLFEHNDPADRFFLVVSGQVKLYRTTIDGHEKVVEVVQAGRSFAEAVMFMQAQSYPVSAAALKPATVYAVPSRAYLALLDAHPGLSTRLLASLSQRLHQRLNEVEALSLQNAGYRLARYLLQRLPADRGNGTRVRLPAAKQVIASQLAIKPETFSRLLRSFAEAGLISVHGAHIEFHDVEGLSQVT